MALSEIEILNAEFPIRKFYIFRKEKKKKNGEDTGFHSILK